MGFLWIWASVNSTEIGNKNINKLYLSLVTLTKRDLRVGQVERAFPKPLLARPAPLVVLCVTHDGTEDHLLHSLPWHWARQAFSSLDPPSDPSYKRTSHFPTSSNMVRLPLTRTAGEWLKVAWWALLSAPSVPLGESMDLWGSKLPSRYLTIPSRITGAQWPD